MPAMQSKKEQLMAAARRLFLKNGYVETLTCSVCREAAVAKGTFFYYFNTKQDIVIDLLEEQLWQQAAELYLRLNKGFRPLHKLKILLEALTDPRLYAPESMAYFKSSPPPDWFLYHIHDFHKKYLIPIVQDVLLQGKSDECFSINNADVTAGMLFLCAEHCMKLRLSEQPAEMEQSPLHLLERFTEQLLCLEHGSIELFSAS